MWDGEQGGDSPDLVEGGCKEGVDPPSSVLGGGKKAGGGKARGCFEFDLREEQGDWGSRSGKILVTGADGFIGSHLVSARALWAHRLGACLLYTAHRAGGWLDHAPTHVPAALVAVGGGGRDAGGKPCMMGDGGGDTVAAVPAPPPSHSPDTYIDTNIKGTLNILQAARE